VKVGTGTGMEVRYDSQRLDVATAGLRLSSVSAVAEAAGDDSEGQSGGVLVQHSYCCASIGAPPVHWHKTTSSQLFARSTSGGGDASRTATRALAGAEGSFGSTSLRFESSRSAVSASALFR